MYQLYLATRHWVELGLEMDSVLTKGTLSADHQGSHAWENAGQNLKLEYIWSPVVNDSMMSALDPWRTGRGPTVLVMGAAMESILMSNNSGTALDHHRRNLTKLRSELENIVTYGGSKVLWTLEPPVYWERLNGSRRVLTNDAIARYNAESSQVFHDSPVIVWSSLVSLTEGTLDLMVDGVKLSGLATSQATQMLLNLLCNDNMNFNDGTCCKSSDHPTSLQIVSLSVLAIGLALSLVIIVYELVCKRHPSHHYMSYSYRLLPRPGQLFQCNLPFNYITNFIFCVAKLSIIMEQIIMHTDE